MPIRRDLGDIPKGSDREGFPPSKRPQVVNVLAEKWFADYQANGQDDKPHAIEGRKFRLSSVAHRCDRQMWFGMNRTPKSNPDTIADSWRMGLGTLVHEGLQSNIDSLGNGWRSEIVVDLRSIGIDGSGSLDLVRFVNNQTGEPMVLTGTKTAGPDLNEMETFYRYGSESEDALTKWLRKGEWDPKVEKPVAVCELKTVNGFKWKMVSTSFKGPAEGPSYAHILQPALGARALDVDNLIVAYLSLENLSPEMAKTFAETETGRFSGEWHYSRVALDDILDNEIARINRIERMVDAEVVPARELHEPTIPAGAVVDDPAQKGRWSVRVGGKITNSGSVHFCSYCPWIDTCIKLGAEPS